MIQKIIIKESELRNLVEGVLNELDWRTYMNAAQKANDIARPLGKEMYYKSLSDKDEENYYKNQKRSLEFRDATNKSFRKTYPGKGRIHHAPILNQTDFFPVDNEFIGNTFSRGITFFNNKPSRIKRSVIDYLDGTKQTPEFVTKEIPLNRRNRMYRNLLATNKGAKDLDAHMAGEDYYDKDQGRWVNPNESLIRSITESVIRRLKRR